MEKQQIVRYLLFAHINEDPSGCLDGSQKICHINQSMYRSISVAVCMFLMTVSYLQAGDQGRSNKNGDILLDIDNPPNGRHQYSDTLSYGTKFTLEYTGENNYDLDPDNSDDQSLMIAEMELAVTYVPSEHWDAFVNFELVEEYSINDDADYHDHETELNIKELNITYRNLHPGIILKVGRQAFKDKREWLYDEELDAIRIYYRNNGLSLEASVSSDNQFERDLLNKDEHLDIYNYFVLGNYYFNEDNTLAAYYFIRDDQEKNERPIWTGFRASGKSEQDAKYWIEYAYVSGRGELYEDEERQNISAYAIDIGGTYVFDAAMQPALTLGYAYGSGDSDPATNGDRNFRQTGLQDNNGRFNGVTRFKYYGEMLEPELSNLVISTIGIGIRPEKKTSFDLIFHTYRQANAADNLRESNLGVEPTGTDSDIGKGFDIVIGYRAIKDLSVEFVYSRFIPGIAFEMNADKSTLFNLKLNYKF